MLHHSDNLHRSRPLWRDSIPTPDRLVRGAGHRQRALNASLVKFAPDSVPDDAGGVEIAYH